VLSRLARREETVCEVDPQARQRYGTRLTSLASKHGIEHSVKLARASGERLLCSLPAPRAGRTASELDCGELPLRHSCTAPSESNKTARNHALALPGSTFAIKGRNSNERGDLTAAEFAEFGQAGQQRCRPLHCATVTAMIIGLNTKACSGQNSRETRVTKRVVT
jgi:hypothetical protein